MDKLRILYVASEISPFLTNTSVGEYVKELLQTIQKRDVEVRVFVPRFGVINERKNNLHEVLRLSGMNIAVGKNEKRLVIKVTSIPNAKLQVYFVDNEELFQRKAVFADEDHHFFEDNDERSIFFCKGVLEAVKELEWEPDIVHCHDWITSFIPLFLKTTYREVPYLKKSKIVFTLYNHTFSHYFGPALIEKVKTHDMEALALAPLASADFAGFIKTAIQYSDTVVRAEALQSVHFPGIVSNESIPYIGHAHEAENEEAYYTLYHKLLET